MRNKVYIVRPSYDYTLMMKDVGWEVVDHLSEADLIIFTGGEDVTPSLYGEERHRTTGCNPLRDKDEAQIFHSAVANAIPMAGICRGGQFLNVMNGGKMYQDVNHHAIGGVHPATIPGIGTVYVTSTHHQQMRVNHDVEHVVLMTANLSTRREHMSKVNTIAIQQSELPLGNDMEAIYYPGTMSLCYQPHPEFNASRIKDTRDVFFFFLRNFPMAEANFKEASEFLSKVSSLSDSITKE